MKVNNEVVWRNKQPFSVLKNISYFGYNNYLNVGIVIDYIPNNIDNMTEGGTEIYYVYFLNDELNDIVRFYQEGQVNVAESERTVKAVLSS